MSRTTMRSANLSRVGRCPAGPSRISFRAASTGSPSTRKGKRKYEPVIFSGIQPTGTPHLGNFLGLFLPFLEMQKSAPKSTPIYLSIVGLHAITLPQDSKSLVEDRRNMLASLLACGVDPERTCLYFQEEVAEHAELAWYLNTLTPVGRLQRMTTWKSRLATSRNANSIDEISESDLKLGLLAYPVLQAADVMLYKSTDIPVGEDQQQHLELARDIAESFNRQFGDIFPLPEMRIVPSKRILSLRDPFQKMSKSAPNPQSRISITDTPSQIRTKIKSAITDSLPASSRIHYDPNSRPGVSNLLTIWSALDGAGRTPEDLARVANEEGWGMGKLKEFVAEVVVDRLEGVRGEYERIRGDLGYLRDVSRRGRERAGEKAAATMEEVRRVVGLGGI